MTCRDEAELEWFADKTVRDKVLEQEVNVIGKKGKGQRGSVERQVDRIETIEYEL